MAWNADGTFSRSYDWTDEAAAGNNISSTKFDTENETFRLGIQNCINKDGKNAPSTDLPMGGNKHTNVGDATARAHYPAVGQIQDGELIWGGTSGGTANVQTIAPSPAITAYATGQQFAFLPGTANTGATTLNVNSVGAKNVKMMGHDILAGALRTDSPVIVVYDGTDFELISNGLRQYCDVVENGGGQALAIGSTDVTFDSDISDPWAMHSTVADTEQIVLTAGGLWLITASLETDAALTGFVHIKLNDADTYLTVDAGGGKNIQVSGMLYSNNVANYVTLVAQNTGAGAVNVSSARISAARVG